MSGSVSMVDGHIDPDKKPMTFEDVKRIRENPTAEDVDNKELHRLIDEAIEKQIPKKVVVDKAYSLGRYVVGICPNCKKMLGLLSFAKDFEHCYECGQALDWSDAE